MCLDLLLYNHKGPALAELYGQIVSFNGSSIQLSTKTTITNLGYYYTNNIYYNYED